MSFLRRTAELASRGVVLRRNLPRSLGGGSLYVSPESGGLRYWRLDLEKVDPTLLAVARRLVTRGACVWDIGANVGLFAFAASFLAGPEGRVVAVEADVDNARLLYKSRQRQRGGAEVDVLCAAISDRPGIAQFAIASRSRSANALVGFGGTQTGGAREIRSVAAMTLDQMADQFGPPTVIKIDVEGAEVGVLAGGRRLFDEHHPAIAIEVSEENSIEVADFLRARGYALHDGDTMLPADTAVWNTVAIHSPQTEIPLRADAPQDTSLGVT